MTADAPIDDPAVALLIFNRPAHTQAVFERIAAARPSRLMVVADGPREDHPDDVSLVRDARAVIDQVDWRCEVSRCYSDVNLGCGERIATGLDWVFDQVPEAILLEDDCLPEPTFFRFCAELLSRYRHDPRVQMIGGSNVLEPDRHVVDSYGFSRGYHIWGWATWARAWRHYDYEMRAWPALRKTSWLADHLGDSTAEQVARLLFDAQHSGQIRQWDFQWVLSGWLRDALCVVPAVNLVTNIGHSDSGTHLRDPSHPLARLPSRPMSFPLRHPDDVAVLEAREHDLWAAARDRQTRHPGGRAAGQMAGALRRGVRSMRRR